jgi:AraC-type transcriptional regulator N-terminus
MAMRPEGCCPRSNRREHATSIPGLTLYRRTTTTPCYPGTYEPSLNVFVQGKKRVTLGGATYLCDGSTFLLSSLDLPVVSQIVEASEEVPLLSFLLKLDMAVVREILNHAEVQSQSGSSELGAVQVRPRILPWFGICLVRRHRRAQRRRILASRCALNCDCESKLLRQIGIF